MRDGGRGAKDCRRHRPEPLAAEVHLPLTAGDDDDRHLAMSKKHKKNWKRRSGRVFG